MSVHVELTVRLWHVLLWLAVGAALWLPLEWLAWRGVARPRTPFWSHLRWALRRRRWSPATAIVLWPLALWEALR